MSKEKQGWIKMYREIMDSSVWENPLFLKVWLWCLLKANHQTHFFPFNGDDLEIQKGSFITGRKKASSKLNVSEQKYRTAIKYLLKTGRINVKTTNKFSVISVVKWDEYQIEEKEFSQQKNNEQTSNKHRKPTYNNDKNEKNDNIIDYQNLKKPFKDFMVVRCRDGSLALRRFTKWVDYENPTVSINIDYYPELK